MAEDAADDAPVAAAAIERIGFGSCDQMAMSQAFWSKIVARQPQVFLFLGDAIYLDHGETYAQLAAVKGFRDLMNIARPLPIWDDHDYGGNDTGASFGGKQQAKKMFFDFWSVHGGVQAGSARWQRDGNYDAVIIGPPGRDVQFLMLDNRWWRGTAPNGLVLGDVEWTWLEGELRKPARLRILMSGMELISTSTTPEGWGQFPKEQQRLYDMIKATGAKALFIVSGDKHYAEISRRDDLGLGYPLYDFTSSPMSAPPEPLEANRYRDTPTASVSDFNFGFVTIDWMPADPTVHVELLADREDRVLLEKRLTLSQLGN